MIVAINKNMHSHVSVITFMRNPCVLLSTIACNLDVKLNYIIHE